jgi:hypothetical protein
VVCARSITRSVTMATVHIPGAALHRAALQQVRTPRRFGHSATHSAATQDARVTNATTPSTLTPKSAAQRTFQLPLALKAWDPRASTAIAPHLSPAQRSTRSSRAAARLIPARKQVRNIVDTLTEMARWVIFSGARSGAEALTQSFMPPHWGGRIRLRLNAVAVRSTTWTLRTPLAEAPPHPQPAHSLLVRCAYLGGSSTSRPLPCGVPGLLASPLLPPCGCRSAALSAVPVSRPVLPSHSWTINESSHTPAAAAVRAAPITPAAAAQHQFPQRWHEQRQSPPQAQWQQQQQPPLKPQHAHPAAYRKNTNCKANCSVECIGAQVLV